MPEVEQSRDIGATAESVWRQVSDPRRLADWVPTMAASHPAGAGNVELRGESHGHDYDVRGGFVADDGARRLSWNSPRHSGYEGLLTVAGHGTGSRVTIRVTVPGLPPDAAAELERGLTEALDRIDQLTRT